MRNAEALIIEIIMRIGVLSDTHILDVNELLPPGLEKAFRGVDLILHGGDIFVPSILDQLEEIAPVLAAAGDDDYGQILTDPRVKPSHTLELCGQTIWLVHERPYIHQPWHCTHSERCGQSVPSIVIFGHEHRPFAQHYGDMLFLNPGSPTLLDYCRGLGTVGLLQIGTGQPQFHITQL